MLTANDQDTRVDLSLTHYGVSRSTAFATAMDLRPPPDPHGSPSPH
jgi:hypothetical protein